MARVLVEVDDPLNLKSGKQPASSPADKTSANQTMPLLVGAYVHVEIDAESMVDVTEVPRQALRAGNRVHVYDDGVLDTREVDIVWKNEDSVLVGHGVEAGERIVVSRIPTPIEGMRLRLHESGKNSMAARAKR